MSGCWVRSAILLALSPVWVGAFQIQTTAGLLPQPASGPHRTVTGTVINGITGEPIRRALVQIGTKSASVLTGADGRFQFEDIAEGAVSLMPQKPGYFDARSTEGFQANSTFTVGAEKNDFRLKLFPYGRIVGTVTDKDGEPITGGSVEVLAEQIIDGHKGWIQRGGSVTDDDGALRIDDLLPGRYLIYFAGNSQNLNGGLEVCAPVYYPEAPDLVSAQAIELRTGEQFRADFHLRTQRGFSIKGRLSGAPAGLMGGLSLQNVSGQVVALGLTQFDQAKGEFSLHGVPPGRWLLNYWANDKESSYMGKQEVSITSADVEGVQMAVFPLASIPMVVNHAQQTEPQAGSVQTAGNIFALLVTEDAIFPQQYGLQVQGDPPEARFVNLPPGKYRLRLPVVGTECMESAWYGNVDLLNDSFVISEGQGRTQPITVNLQSNCATVNVHVKAKDQQKSGIVLAVSSNPKQDPVSWPWAPQMPLSQVLSPGSYQLYAFSNAAGLEYANPEAMRGYVGQSVTLTAGQKADVTLELVERKEN